MKGFGGKITVVALFVLFAISVTSCASKKSIGCPVSNDIVENVNC